MLYYNCPRCGLPMSSPDSLAGKAETCPVCHAAAQVPGPSEMTERDLQRAMLQELHQQSLYVKVLVVWFVLIPLIAFAVLMTGRLAGAW